MKGQFTPLGAILIVAILIALISGTYLWSLPVIQEQQSVVLYEYSKGELDKIRNAIHTISAAEGAQQIVQLNLKNIMLNVHERDESEASNSIEFQLESQLGILSDKWTLIDPSENDKEPVGKLGEDLAGVITANEAGNKITMRLHYRDLYDSDSGKYYRINLLKSTPWIVESGRTTVVFKNTGQYQDGKYLVTDITVMVG